MKSSAHIVADSVSPNGDRVTTFQLRIPRFVLPQLTRHRMFAYNVRSSRAITSKQLREEVYNNPYVPAVFGHKGKGMQPKGDLAGLRAEVATFVWLCASRVSVLFAYLLDRLGVAKEIANRPLEPFAYTDLVMTGCSYVNGTRPWANFFRYRCHPHAQREIREVAEMMEALYETNIPEITRLHTPYVHESEVEDEHERQLVSAARCARVSYIDPSVDLTHKDRDLALAKKLLASDPPHMGPFEHTLRYDPFTLCGVFEGWLSKRHVTEDSEGGGQC